MPVQTRTSVALLTGVLLAMVPGPASHGEEPGPVVLHVHIWDGGGAMTREARLEVVEAGAAGGRSGEAVPLVADWEPGSRREHRANTSSARTPALDVGVRYRLRYWPGGVRGSATEVPVVVTAAMCPRGCERDAVVLVLERNGRARARGTPVLAATGALEAEARVVPGPLVPLARTRR